MTDNVDELQVIMAVSKRRIPFHDDVLQFKYAEDYFYTEYSLCKWLDKFTTGRWGIEFLKIGFEKEQDAIIYNMRFGL